MAQTGFTPISIYYSSTASAAPTAGNLVAGELAINTADGKLFYKDSSGVVQTIASKGTGTIGGSTTQVQYNNAGAFAGSANFVWDNTNAYLGIGTSSPTGIIHTNSTSSQRWKMIGTTGLKVIQMDGSGDTFYVGQDDSTGSVFSQGGYTRLLYSQGAYPMAFSTNSIERMRIDSSGNLLVGTTSANYSSATRGLIELNGSSTALFAFKQANTATAYIQSSTNLELFNVANSAMVFGTNGSERMRIDSSGNVGIGTSSPNHRLDVQSATGTMGVTSSTGTNISYAFASNTGGSFLLGKDSSTGALTGTAYSNFLYNGSAYPMLFLTNGGERMRIFSTGEVGIGRTNSSGALLDLFNASSSSGVIRARNDLGGAQTFAIFDYGGSNIGSITGNNTITAYNVTSDRRLKENIIPFNGGLSTVIALKPSQYNYIADKETTYQGFIADELQTVVPHAVTGEVNAVDEEGKPIYQGLDASFLIPHLVSAIQELNAKITALENK
jgi:hypothetical protein